MCRYTIARDTSTAMRSTSATVRGGGGRLLLLPLPPGPPLRVRGCAGLLFELTVLLAAGDGPCCCCCCLRCWALLVLLRLYRRL